MIKNQVNFIIGSKDVQKKEHIYRSGYWNKFVNQGTTDFFHMVAGKTKELLLKRTEHACLLLYSTWSFEI